MIALRPYLLLSALGVAVLASVACGQTLSTVDRPCPCETGWTCCQDNVCVPPGASCGASTDASASQCPDGIIIGTGSVPTFGPDGAAEAFPKDLSMTGQVIGTIPEDGTTAPFDYAASTTLSGGVVQEQGWIVIGGNTQRYHFEVYAEYGESQLPLQLAVYGPIELGPNNGTCFAPLVDNGSLADGTGMFEPPIWGKYFVAAYHSIDVAENGTVAIQAAGDPRYQSAYLVMQPADD